MSTKLYCQVTGIVLLGLGALGIMGIGLPGLIMVNGTNQIIGDLILGALGVYAGFRDHSKEEMYARVFGVVVLLLGIGGFVLPGLIHMDMGSNVLHIALGAWGVYLGYIAHGQMSHAEA